MDLGVVGVKRDSYILPPTTFDMDSASRFAPPLYHPSYEHDSCGIGFVANIDGHKSRNVVTGALSMLENMEHRGGQGAEPTSGDGAGILVQIPHAFLSESMEKDGVVLPKAGCYGVGATFFSPGCGPSQEVHGRAREVHPQFWDATARLQARSHRLFVFGPKREGL